MRLYNYGTKNLRKVTRNFNQENFPYMDFKKTMESNVKKGYIDYITLPQMGETRRMFTAKLSKGVKTFMNPKLVYNKKSEKITVKEKCNSLPDIETEVERYSEVMITYMINTEHGLTNVRETYKGKDACIIQHCYDHLDGIFNIDYKDEDYLKSISDKLNEISLSKERPVNVGRSSKKKSIFASTGGYSGRSFTSRAAGGTDQENGRRGGRVTAQQVREMADQVNQELGDPDQARGRTRRQDESDHGGLYGNRSDASFIPTNIPGLGTYNSPDEPMPDEPMTEDDIDGIKRKLRELQDSLEERNPQSFQSWDEIFTDGNFEYSVDPRTGEVSVSRISGFQVRDDEEQGEQPIEGWVTDEDPGIMQDDDGQEGVLDTRDNDDNDDVDENPQVNEREDSPMDFTRKFMKKVSKSKVRRRRDND